MSRSRLLVSGLVMIACGVALIAGGAYALDRVLSTSELVNLAMVLAPPSGFAFLCFGIVLAVLGLTGLGRASRLEMSRLQVVSRSLRVLGAGILIAVGGCAGFLGFSDADAIGLPVGGAAVFIVGVVTFFVGAVVFGQSSTRR